ncbi:hypothetical protein BKA80DRAFT_275412 [Phyllosticta citrichinensis]
MDGSRFMPNQERRSPPYLLHSALHVATTPSNPIPTVSQPLFFSTAQKWNKLHHRQKSLRSATRTHRDPPGPGHRKLAAKELSVGRLLACPSASPKVYEAPCRKISRAPWLRPSGRQGQPEQNFSVAPAPSARGTDGVVSRTARTAGTAPWGRPSSPNCHPSHTRRQDKTRAALV